MAYTFCTKCGQQVSDQDRFCPGCGAPVVTAQNTSNNGQQPYGGQPGTQNTPGYGPQNPSPYGGQGPAPYGQQGPQNYNRNFPQQNIPQGPKGLAIASMVVGICSVVFTWVPPLAIVLGALALIFGIVSVAKKMGGKGMAVAGIVTGAVGFLYAIEVAITYGNVFSLFGRRLW